MERIPPSNTARSVLVIDDHPLFVDALSAVVERAIQPKQLQSVASILDAMALIAQRYTPSLVFLDLKLPDIAGLSGYFKLHQRLPNAQIVVVSATSNPPIIRSLYAEGAAGFISKNTSHEELERDIIAVSRGERVFPADLDIDAPAPNTDQAQLNDIAERLARLTPQQSKILTLIALGKLNKQIAFELGLTEATVKTHITALLKNLRVQNRTQAALIANEANLNEKLEG